MSDVIPVPKKHVVIKVIFFNSVVWKTFKLVY